MEVLVGPTFSIDVSSSAYVRDAAQDNRAAVASCLGVGSASRILAPDKPPVDVSSDSSSSIGAPDDSDEDEEQDDASSKADDFRGRSFGSLASLEESLPIKRGLSNHFSGKSKSFGNLSDVGEVKDLEKKENPLNKRRRVFIASKWSRKSFYSWANPKSMPLLTLQEDEESHGEPEKEKGSLGENDDDSEPCRFLGLPKLHERMRLKSFKARSCLSLADLQEHNRLMDEEEEEEEDED